MRSLADLAQTLRRIDGRGYRAYKDIAGDYRADGFVLCVDHVQGDPFADPSRIRVVVSPGTSGLPDWTRSDDARCVSSADFLNRRLTHALDDLSSRQGSGKSGVLRALRPGQEVLERTSLVVFDNGEVEARFQVGLPAAGRRVLGRQADVLLTRTVPEAVERALVFGNLSAEAFAEHVEAVELAQVLRGRLEERSLLAFVGDGAILPRRSGEDDRPLPTEEATPFQSPDALRVTLEGPAGEQVTGMGIPSGVTLIVGGGFHGKSTLLRAIERGVYDHVPGDGRERVVTVPGAVKVRAEDGRSVSGTDISNFIGCLPGGQDTTAFSTSNASGSTSQAAAIVEALELGATCLLMDEDTSATNLMIRDARMQALVPDDLEPITPFIDPTRELADAQDVSTILVVGGSGDYFDVADTVVAMEAYVPRLVTEEARDIAQRLPTRRRTGQAAWRPIATRVPTPRSVDAARGRRRRHIKTPTDDRLLFGEEEVPLGAVEQLVEVAQTRAIAHALAYAEGRCIDGERSLPKALELVMQAVEREGLEVLTPHLVGNLSAFRVFELAAVLNRLRTLRVR